MSNPKFDLSLFDPKSGQIRSESLDLHQTDFSHAKLIGIDLGGIDLSRADFSHADLRGATLKGANLLQANLTGAILNRANLEGANLSQSNPIEAKLQVCRYDRHTVWPEDFNYKSSGAIGPSANLNGAFLNTAYLRDADLTRANLLGAYMCGTDLRGANLANARMSSADLRLASLVGAYLRGVSFNNVNLAGTDLRAADLTGVEIDQIESIAGADFSRIQGMSDNLRALLRSRPAKELDVWNAFTRQTTRNSLEIL
jgi:uncharacterized protein YjbI with pentapeptide repeats